jgi:hypothetical protein
LSEPLDLSCHSAKPICKIWLSWLFEIEFVTSNDKPRIVAYRYIIEASIDVS